ncbi:MAG: DUF5011 domain-containing protein [Candidatus Hydrogenedens sp.]|nr:DUF5011 domain-containing protein [Candidatus Hydrogenedens sp.]
MLNLVARSTRRGTWGASALGLAAAIILALPGLAAAQCITVDQRIISRGADGRVPIEVTVSSTCDEVYALGAKITVPNGFTVPIEISGAVPELDLNLSGGVVSGTWDLLWTTTPAFPFTFTYTLQEPEDWDGTVQAKAQALYRVLDGGQTNSAIDSVDIIAADAPVVTLLGDSIIELNCKDEYIEPGFTAEDNIDGDITDEVNITGAVNTSRAGDYTLTYQVQNSFGFDSAVKQRVVVVRDSDSPTLTLIGSTDITLECKTPFVDPGYTATDPCEGDLTSRVVVSGTVNTSTPGSYTLAYNVADSGGNAAVQLTRRITVVDTIAPTITLIGNPTINLEVECGTTFTDPGATAADLCGGDLTASIVKNLGGLDTRTPGVYTLSYNVKDAANNNARVATRTVTVVDKTAPTITLAGANPQIIQCGSPYTELGATATDLCKGGLPVTINSSAVDTSTPGTYTVTYRASDGTTQTQQRTRTVRVEDTTAPKINLTGGAVTILECGEAFVEPGVEATDNCDEELDVVSDAATQVKNGVPGSYRVTYTVTDGSGNSDSASRLVVVEDHTAPVITLTGNATETIECTSAYVDAGATATDACGGDLSVNVVTTGANVNTSVPGTYTVRYNVTDKAGNAAAEVKRTVTVVDRAKPVITLNGGDFTIDCGDSYTDPGAIAFDECNGDLTGRMVVTGTNFDRGSEGVYTITYTVRDNSGNIATASRTVTVAGSGCIIPEEGEGALEGEGEGTVELEDCAIESVSLTSPPSNVIIPQGTGKTTIRLSADLAFAATDDCLPVDVEMIYAIDGVVLGSSSDIENGFPIDIELGLGSYFLTATAIPNGDQREAVSDLRRFAVIEGIDSDSNGLLDNPFVNLPGDGDLWVANGASLGCTRRTIMKSWLGDGAGGLLTLSIANPDDPDQVYSITVRRDLIVPGEQGVVVATISCDPASILAPEDASAAVNNVPAGPLFTESFLDLSIIVSDDDGLTFSELDDVSVDGAPGVTLRYDSDSLLRGTIFRAFETIVDGSDQGVVLKPVGQGWSRAGISNEVSATRRLSADLSRLSLFGEFVQIDLPADLKADTGAINFGSLVRNAAKTADVRITNVGDAELSGTATAQGNGFSVVGTADYTLGSGDSAVITVRFSPASQGTFEGTLALSGDPNGNIVVELTGVGTLFDKGDSATGCGTGSDAGGGPLSDVLVALAVFAALLAAANVMRKRAE